MSRLSKIYEELKDGVRRGNRKSGTHSLRGKAPGKQIKMASGRLTKIVLKGGSNRAPATIAARVLEVRALADRIFGDEKKAEAWLHRPNASLSGQVPLDLLNDDLGAAVVRETLEQVDHGIFA